MHLSEKIQTELDYFRRLNEHFEIQCGSKSIRVKDAEYKLLYMAMSASLAMDISEDGFFEDFVVTDKAMSGRDELLIDAYALIDADSSSEKHLHVFQFKIHDKPNHAASPRELMDFATLINNVFVHPELRADTDLNNEVLQEMDAKMKRHLEQRRGNKVFVHCHFINNAQGVNRSNEQHIQDLLGRFEYDKQHRRFNIQVYGLKEIEELATEGKIAVDKETISFALDSPYPYRFEDNSRQAALGLPNRVFLGVCNVNELIRLQNKYHHNQLYSENIRLYLGDRAAVNKDIIKTITSRESIWFPYMNNGISIICDDLTVGTPNTTKQTISLDLKNLQIINGCQTVNALYSAKYDDATRDNFKPNNIVVRIYQIDPAQRDFKQSIIKATNNQNAVKTYSLLSNDPIQIEIQAVLRRLNFLYDRKGEARQEKSNRVVSMPNAALAYRAVFGHEAQSLRSRIGQSRVFQKTEYEKIFPEETLEDQEKMNSLSVRLLTAALILDSVRELIPKHTAVYPIIKKCAYYLAGLVYAQNQPVFDGLMAKMCQMLEEGNPHKIKAADLPSKVVEAAQANFGNSLGAFSDFYKQSTLDKTDLDNLLKSKPFGEAYQEFIRSISPNAG
ncbi:MAG: AIPR family protein [Saprospiraceae bacterium]